MKKSELQSLINECIGEVLNEGKAAKKKEAIKKIKNIIAENELSEADLAEIDVRGAFKKAATKAGEFMGTKWPKEKAEAEYRLKFAKEINNLAKEYNTDAATLKNALINIMMKIGGMAVLKGANKVEWDATKKEFTKPGTTLGGAGGVVGG
jgi:hypothetical protein